MAQIADRCIAYRIPRAVRIAKAALRTRRVASQVAAAEALGKRVRTAKAIGVADSPVAGAAHYGVRPIPVSATVLIGGLAFLFATTVGGATEAIFTLDRFADAIAASGSDRRSARAVGGTRVTILAVKRITDAVSARIDYAGRVGATITVVAIDEGVAIVVDAIGANFSLWDAGFAAA